MVSKEEFFLQMNNKNITYRRSLLMLAVTALFSVLATVVDRQAIGPEDTVVGFASINGAFARSFGYNAVMDKVSDIMMYIAFVVVISFVVIGVKKLVQKKSIQAVGKTLLGLGILYFIVAVIYVAFKKIPINYRPIIPPGETEIETSFPSTHTLIIGSVMGSAVIAWNRLFSNKKLVRCLTILAVLVMVIGICARMLAGVHWLSDIAAGILFSATLIAFYSAWIAD